MKKHPLHDRIMTKRVRGYIIVQLCQGYYPKEVTLFAMEEFKMDWGLTQDTPQSELLQIQKYVYERARDFLYDDKHAQEEIKTARREWLKSLSHASRDASKSFRVAELSRLKELCIKSKDYRTAVLAVRQIAIECEGINVNVGGTVNHEHRKVETESEINARIQELLKASEAPAKDKDAVLALLARN